MFFSVSLLLHSTIWEVNQDGSGDFTTVQYGINAAANNDTVLVYPGIYYENLFIQFKTITIGSLYLTTGDDFYIPYTILDGNQESSVIRIDYVPSYPDLIISGFTIQNGIGYEASDGRAGGGIFAWESSLSINKCIIQNNHAEFGGGICLGNSFLDLSGSTIRFNECNDSGGGLLIGAQCSDVQFDTIDLNNIYLNYALMGNDIYLTQDCPFQEIIVDTFTVLNPDDNYYFIYPSSGGAGFPLPNHYSIDVQHGYVEQIDQDIYVSADGDDSNSGLSPADPLQTIAYALVKINADSLEQRSIHIADGVYTASQNNQIWPLQIKSNINIIGESRDNTILDAEFSEGFFRGGSGQSNYKIENLSFLHHHHGQDIFLDGNTSVYLNNLYMADSQTARSIIVHFSDVSFENITIENSFPGDLYYYCTVFSSKVLINNLNFYNNLCNIPISITKANSELDTFTIINSEITNNEGLIYEWLPTCSGVSVSGDMKLNLVNSTLGDNFNQYTGAAVRVENNTELYVVNSIIYDNEPYNICLDGRLGTNTLTTNNSLIGGGIDGILNINTNIINWDYLTMLDEDPLWLGAGYEFPYSLSVNSPCIDTGTLELPYGVELPAYDLAGNPRVMGSNIDMGAYEYPGNAAPIYLEINNENLTWQIPAGFAPDSYNVYLDDEYQANVSAFQMEYILHNLIIGQTYKAGVSAVYAGEETAIIPQYFTYNPVGIEETTHLLPLTSHLSNYPNPFNPSTTINFNVTQSSVFATLEIFNIKGQKVKTLVNAQLASGNYKITWNGKDANNKRVSSGQYIVKLKQNEKETAKKIMMLK